jgi:2-keto-4-pentenoate hydratase/2-oxohepta-3-ene-1,7-dioic acid hydratase in catechol pathway
VAGKLDRTIRDAPMKLCRFNENRVGVVSDGYVHDVTDAITPMLQNTWPCDYGDTFVGRLPSLRPVIEKAIPTARRFAIDAVCLLSPIARPPKIIAAPVNYKRHLAESINDPGIHYGAAVKDIRAAGLFLKSPTSLIGSGTPIRIRFPERRNDHEIELAVVMGRMATRVSREAALDHVAGYCVGLDITVRGTEDRSFRKSPDTYTVLGPWMVTADELSDPSNLKLSLKVNADIRQTANTSDLLIGVPGLIEFASSWYTLYPGDIIFSGTPEGVGPITGGDVMTAYIERIGEMRVVVARATDV